MKIEDMVKGREYYLKVTFDIYDKDASDGLCLRFETAKDSFWTGKDVKVRAVHQRVQYGEPSNIDPRFALTEVTCQADSYAQMSLWRTYAHESDTSRQDWPWKQDNSGLIKTVDTIAGQSINLSFSWCQIKGKRVLFWEVTGYVADFHKIESWFKKHCPNAKAIDPMNFHNAFR